MTDYSNMSDCELLLKLASVQQGKIDRLSKQNALLERKCDLLSKLLELEKEKQK